MNKSPLLEGFCPKPNERVRITRGAFAGKTGTCTGASVGKCNQKGYLIKMDDSPLNALILPSQMVKSITSDEAFLKSLYRRYSFIKLETLGEVLDLLEHHVSTIDDAKSVIGKFLHQNYRRSLRHPMHLCRFLPRKTRKMSNNELANVLPSNKAEDAFVGVVESDLKNTFGPGTVIETDRLAQADKAVSDWKATKSKKKDTQWPQCDIKKKQKMVDEWDFEDMRMAERHSKSLSESYTAYYAGLPPRRRYGL